MHLHRGLKEKESLWNPFCIAVMASVLGTFVVSTTIFFAYTKTAVLERTYDAEQRTFSTVSHVLDSLAVSSETAAVQISDDTQLRQLLHDPSIDVIGQTRSIIQLERYRDIIPGLYSLYVLNPTTDRFYVMDSEGWTYAPPADSFFDEELPEVLETSRAGTEFPIVRSIREEDSQTAVVEDHPVYTFVYDFIDHSGQLDNSSIVINISIESVGSVDDGFSPTGRIFAIATDGVLVTVSDRYQFGDDLSGLQYISRILDSADNSGYFVTDVDDEKSFVSYLTRSNPGWTFVRVLPYKLVLANFWRLSTNSAVVVLGLLLGGLAIAYITRSMIRRRFTETLNEFKTVDGEREQNYSALKDSALLGLLDGTGDSDLVHLRSVFATFSIPMEPGADFMLLILCLDEYQRLLRENRTRGMMMLRQGIEIQVERVLSDLCAVEFIDTRPDEMSLLIQFNGGVPDIESIMSTLVDLHLTIKKVLGVSASLVVADPGPVDRLPASFKACRRVLERRFLADSQGVYFAEEGPEVLSDGYEYPFERELKMERAILSGNMAEAQLHFHDIVDGISDLPAKLARRTIVRLAYCINRCIETIEMNGWLRSEKYNFYVFLRDLDEAASISTVHEIFERQFRLLQRKKSERLTTQHQNLVEAVEAIVSREYMDPMLYRVSIADKVGVSPEYLSRLFKQATGKSLSVFINDVRMEHAEEFLRDPDLPINTVLSKSGFNSPTWFYKVFKRRNGVTPAEYRSKHLSRSALRKA